MHLGKHTMEMRDLLDDYCDQQEIYRFEGRKGIENLSRIARALGYTDPQFFGQFKGGCIGDLLVFLEDNPGAMEAVVKWIGEQYSTEWQAALKSKISKSADGDL